MLNKEDIEFLENDDWLYKLETEKEAEESIKRGKIIIESPIKYLENEKYIELPF